MRLIDQVGRSVRPRVLPGATDEHPLRMSDACDCAREVLACPVHYVLDDGLVRICTELTFSDGDRLASCLDLIHLPHPTVWVEWNDGVRQEVLASAPSRYRRASHRDSSYSASAPDDRIYRAGVLLSASRGGRCGWLRTFWSASNGNEAWHAPLETHIDLDRDWATPDPLGTVFDGDWARLHDSEDPGVAGLLEHLRFRFDPAGAAYYRGNIRGDDDRSQLLRGSIHSVSRDIPMLLAFFLLLNSRGGLPQRSVDGPRIDGKHVAGRKAPLLSHIEVGVPMELAPNRAPTGQDTMVQAAPIQHLVFGRLFRRGPEIKWRRKHWRGNFVGAHMESRTVTFSFGGQRPR